MSQRKTIPALLAMTVLAAAMAPASWAQDARLASRAYKADEIVRVEGKLNVQATIAFGEGEKIENVAVGDSDSWQIAPNKRADLLFIKPLTETARTNMTVVTDRHTYFFDLVASPKAQPIYALRFTYAVPPPPPVAEPAAVAQPVAVAQAEPAATQPSAAEQRAQARRVAAAAKAAREAEAKRLDDQRKANRQAARASEAAEAKRAADARAAERAAAAARVPAAKPVTSPAAAAAQPQPASRRDRQREAPAIASAPVIAGPAPWRRSGSRDLMPQTIYDDGRSTYAVWPAGKPLPQMLVSDAQGREVPVAFSVDGEKIVIPGVPGRIVLRANGKAGALEPGRPVPAARPDPAGQ